MESTTVPWIGNDKTTIMQHKYLNFWKSRDLTYFGKKLIIKSFVLSVIGYEIEMRGIPVLFEKEINSIIWDFIWDGKTNQISRNVCSLPQNKGGMGMVNLNQFIKAKQVKCMHNIIHSELDKCNVIGKYWLTSMDSKFETDFFFSVNVQISKILD